MAPEQLLPDARLVDLFAGPGGLDVAATWLGIRSVGIEWDEDACATRDEARLDTVRADVRALGPADFPSASILTGGPPCQTFTVAGTGDGRRALQKVLGTIDRMGRGDDVTQDLAALDDERTGLVLEPLRWLLDALKGGHPYEAVVLEQVPAVLPIWKAIAAVLRQHDYRTAVGTVRTEQYGVPQTRRRALLLAHRERQPFLPTPTHEAYRGKTVPNGESQDLLPWVPMKDVVERGEAFTAISNYGTGGNPAARGRRSSDEPAATVTGKVRRARLEALATGALFTEPDDRLSYAEAGQLQTFPSDYPWSGRDLGQQIGNAIPPRLAAHALAAVLGVDLPAWFLDRRVAEGWPSDLDEDVITQLRAAKAQFGSRDRRSDSALFAL